MKSHPLPIARHWINGSWRDFAQHADSFNPANGERIGSYAVGGADEAKEAAATASQTFRQTDWKSNRELRVRTLHELAHRFEVRAVDLRRRKL